MILKDMSGFFELIRLWHKRSWEWFVRHAHSRHALGWLAAVAFTDAIFFPIAPEVFLVALMLAHPKRWRVYLPVSIISTTLGALVGYGVAALLFHQFGEPILAWYGLGSAFAEARHLIAGHVFVAMMVASFTPIPDKVFIYAGGFLGVHILPFITGYIIGRGIRMALVCYLTHRFGARILELMSDYIRVAAVIVLIIIAYYASVHFHVLGL